MKKSSLWTALALFGGVGGYFAEAMGAPALARYAGFGVLVLGLILAHGARDYERAVAAAEEDPAND